MAGAAFTIWAEPRRKRPPKPRTGYCACCRWTSFRACLRPIAMWCAAFGEGSYPGSPLIAARLLRAKDRLVAIEKHPEDHAALAAAFAGERGARAILGDFQRELARLLPPPERRGVMSDRSALRSRGRISCCDAHGDRCARAVRQRHHPVLVSGKGAGQNCRLGGRVLERGRPLFAESRIRHRRPAIICCRGSGAAAYRGRASRGESAVRFRRRDEEHHAVPRRGPWPRSGCARHRRHHRGAVSALNCAVKSVQPSGCGFPVQQGRKT